MKMSRLSAAVGALVLVSMVGLTVAAQQQRGSQQPSIQGVWRLVEAKLAGLNMPTTPASPFRQDSLWVFTGNHHVIVGENDLGKSRPDIPDLAKATGDELRAHYQPIYARAGTYEIKGDLLTEHNFVDIISRRSKPGNFVTWTYKLDGDTLSVTSHSNIVSNGRVANPGTWTFKRVAESTASR